MSVSTAASPSDSVHSQLLRVLGITLLICLSCGTSERAERVLQDDKLLRIAIPSDARTLDPAIAYDVVTWPLVRALYHGLVDYDDDLNLIPWQSQGWEVSSDGATISFELIPGIQFSNGREVIAQDYVYSITRVLNPATLSPGQGFFRNIAGAVEYQNGEAGSVIGLEAPSRYQFIVTLLRPDPTFLHILAMPFSYVVPKEEVMSAGKDFAHNPVGSGAFVLTEWHRGSSLRFDRSPTYAWPDRVRLDTFEIMVGGDGALHMMMFERGELDIANVTDTGIPDPDFVRIMRDPDLRKYVESQPLNATRYLSLNTEMPPFDNVLVRRAVNHAIDKDRLITLMSDRAVPAKSVLPPGMPGYNPDLLGYPYDPDRAQALLVEAGYPEGFETELWINAAETTETRQAQSIQQDLAKVGVKISIKAVTGATRIEAVGRRNTVPMAHFGWYQDYPDPSNFLDVLLNGTRITDVNSNNVAFYSNPLVNDLLGKAAYEIDNSVRLNLYQEAERIIVDDAPWVFLFHPNMYILRQPWLRGLDLNPVWPIRYERMWIASGKDN